MNTTPTEPVEYYHRVYCELTGQDMRDLPLDWWRRDCWQQWINARLTIQDLRDLVAQKQREMKKGRSSACLIFRWFVAQISERQEDAAMLRAQRRVPKVTERKRVLAATGRAEPSIGDFRSVREILDDPSMADSPDVKAWNQLKAQLR